MWYELKDDETLKNISDESKEKLVLIFKYSTKCSVSAVMLGRLERNWEENEMTDFKLYFLDLIRYREISNMIEEKYNVVHHSPQVLVIRNDKCIYHRSHMGIDYEEIKKLNNRISVN